MFSLVSAVEKGAKQWKDEYSRRLSTHATHDNRQFRTNISSHALKRLNFNLTARNVFPVRQVSRARIFRLIVRQHEDDVVAVSPFVVVFTARE